MKPNCIPNPSQRKRKKKELHLDIFFLLLVKCDILYGILKSGRSPLCIFYLFAKIETIQHILKHLISDNRFVCFVMCPLLVCRSLHQDVQALRYVVSYFNILKHRLVSRYPHRHCEKERLWSCTPLYFWNLIRCSWISLWVMYNPDTCM